MRPSSDEEKESAHNSSKERVSRTESIYKWSIASTSHPLTGRSVSRVAAMNRFFTWGGRQGIVAKHAVTMSFVAESRGRGSLVVKVSDPGWHVTSSSPVPLKTRRVGQRCTLNLSRAQKCFRWFGVVVRRGGASSGVVHVTRPWFKKAWSVAKSPCVAEECDVNIHSLMTRDCNIGPKVQYRLSLSLNTSSRNFRNINRILE
ncbi:uncharacterized protein TNCV_4266191 [Trichonephila clavipes]|nr:uncharacterized protein TNCV_4266191 [Trichonephila clavipes]